MKEIRSKLFGSHDPYADVPLTLPNPHGWGSTAAVFEYLINLIKPKTIIEVGSWLGGSARHMVSLVRQQQPDMELVCVDTWLGSVEHWDGQAYQFQFQNGRPTLYNEFLSNTIHDHLQDFITPFPIDSINGFLVLQKFQVVADLIYIDAGHDYDSVKKDLEHWPQLLRSGGYLLGDDYHHGPIIKAVADVLGQVEARDGKFFWRKP